MTPSTTAAEARDGSMGDATSNSDCDDPSAEFPSEEFTSENRGSDLTSLIAALLDSKTRSAQKPYEQKNDLAMKSDAVTCSPTKRATSPLSATPHSPVSGTGRPKQQRQRPQLQQLPQFPQSPHQ